MLISECVCDMFTLRIFYDDTNTTVASGGMGEVPYFGGMITPGLCWPGF
jgi:hypothetical protein